jgi:hypothetical protein
MCRIRGVFLYHYARARIIYIVCTYNDVLDCGMCYVM